MLQFLSEHMSLMLISLVFICTYLSITWWIFKHTFNWSGWLIFIFIMASIIITATLIYYLKIGVQDCYFSYWYCRYAHQWRLGASAHRLFAPIITYDLITSSFMSIGIFINIYRIGGRIINYMNIIVKIFALTGLTAAFDAITLVTGISSINTSIIYFVTSFLVILYLGAISFQEYFNICDYNRNHDGQVNTQP